MENVALVGLRVLRGPDWAGGDKDGGEGHLGTVKEVLRNRHVRVLWDTGQESICKAGAEGKTELRIFDTAVVGVCHSGSLCSSCGEKDIFGALWICVDCTTCDLCSTCYALDQHDTDHCFYRLDFQNAPRVAVGQRKASVRLGAVGLLPGARVRRGKDWAWGDQDGGQDSEGTLEKYEEVGPLFKRALMRVRWGNGGTNIYRVGFKGHVDVICMEEEARFFYYRDHLPCLGTGNFADWSDEGIISYQAAGSVHPDEGLDGIPSHGDDKRSTTVLLGTANSAEGGTDLHVKAEDISDVHPEDSSAAQNEDCGVDGGELQKTFLQPNMEVVDAEDAELKFERLSERKEDGGQEKYRDLATKGAVSGPGVGGRFPGSGSDKGFALGAYASPKEDLSTLIVGNKAAIRVSEDCLRVLQKDFGGTTMGMVSSIGLTGVVTSISAAGAVNVRFLSLAYRFNPDALIKVCELKVGQRVRISTDVDLVKVLNTRVGWVSPMNQILGRVGKITKVDSDGDLRVDFGDCKYNFAPGCCTPEPGDDFWRDEGTQNEPQVSSLNDSDDDSSGDSLFRKLTSAGGIRGLGGLGALGGLGGLGFRELRSVLSAARDDDGDSDVGRLHVAINNSDIDRVRSLCAANPSLVNAMHKDLTPLMQACLRGKRHIVRELLKLGADVNAQGVKQQTALGVALEAKEEEIALLLLERGADAVQRNSKDRTPLHMATSSGMTEAAQVLIYTGADVNAQDKYGDTPLHDAISTGRDFLAEIFIQMDTVNTTIVNKNGFNPLQLACYKGNACCVSQLLTRDRSAVDKLFRGDLSALHMAVIANCIEAVRLLVNIGGADFNLVTGDRGLSALHLAGSRKFVPLVELLLDLGADVNVQDREGDTPLHHAMGASSGRHLTREEREKDTSERIRVSSILITHGAFVDIKNRQGKTALVYGRSEIRTGVELFMKANPQLVRFKSARRQVEESGPVKTMLLTSALKGLSLTDCLTCGARADGCAMPCGHTTLCATCSARATRCPLCERQVLGRQVAKGDVSFTASALSGGIEPGVDERGASTSEMTAHAGVTSVPASVSSASVSSNVWALMQLPGTEPRVASDGDCTKVTQCQPADSRRLAGGAALVGEGGEAGAGSSAVAAGLEVNKDVDDDPNEDVTADLVCLSSGDETVAEAGETELDKSPKVSAATLFTEEHSVTSLVDNEETPERCPDCCDLPPDQRVMKAGGTVFETSSSLEFKDKFNVDEESVSEGAEVEAVGEAMRLSDDTPGQNNVASGAQYPRMEPSSDIGKLLDPGSLLLTCATDARVLPNADRAADVDVTAPEDCGPPDIIQNVDKSQSMNKDVADDTCLIRPSAILTLPHQFVSTLDSTLTTEVVETDKGNKCDTLNDESRDVLENKDAVEDNANDRQLGLSEPDTLKGHEEENHGAEDNKCEEAKLYVDDDETKYASGFEKVEACEVEIQSVEEVANFKMSCLENQEKAEIQILHDNAKRWDYADGAHDVLDNENGVTDKENQAVLDSEHCEEVIGDDSIEDTQDEDQESNVSDEKSRAVDQDSMSHVYEEETCVVNDNENRDNDDSENLNFGESENQKADDKENLESYADENKDVDDEDTTGAYDDGNRDFGEDENRIASEEENHNVDDDENCDVDEDENRDVDEDENRDVEEDENCDVDEDENRDVEEDEKRDVDEDENRDVEEDENCDVDEDENRDVDEDENRDVEEDENCDVDEDENRDVEDENRDVEEDENRDVEEDENRDVHDDKKWGGRADGILDAAANGLCDVLVDENHDEPEDDGYENCDVSEDETSQTKPLRDSSKPGAFMPADILQNLDEAHDLKNDLIVEKQDQVTCSSEREYTEGELVTEPHDGASAGEGSPWSAEPKFESWHIAVPPLTKEVGLMTCDNTSVECAETENVDKEEDDEKQKKDIFSSSKTRAPDMDSHIDADDHDAADSTVLRTSSSKVRGQSPRQVFQEQEIQQMTTALTTSNLAFLLSGSAMALGAPGDSQYEKRRAQDLTLHAQLLTQMVQGSPVEACNSECAVDQKEPLKDGDRVAIKVCEERLKELQHEYGEVSKGMVQCIGRTGTVTGTVPRGGVTVRFQTTSYRINPDALKKVCNFSRGDTVRIVSDLALLKIFNTKVGWRTAMAEAAGKVGMVTHIDTDNNVVVTFGQRGVLFAPASCMPAPGASQDTLPEVELGPETRRNAAVKEEKKIQGQQEMKKRLTGSVKQDSDLDSVSSIVFSDKSSHLHEAIKVGDCTKVSSLCQADPTLLNQERRGLTPLIYACHKGQLKVVNLLLDCGADVNGVSREGRSALSVALESKNEEIALLLLDRGADPRYTSRKARTALHMAAYNNLSKAFQILVNKGADVNAKDMSGDTPLLDALTMDHRGIADILLALDSVDINHANNRDITALHAASVRGNSAAVERILARDKTNVNKKIDGEISPLHLATNDNHVDVMRLLVINGGADVNIASGGTREGYTPLHHACFKGHFEAVETLLELGAQVNVYTKIKESPLHLAMGSPLQKDTEEFHDDPILRKRTQIACLLITNGAFVDVEDNMGRPPTRYGLQEVRAAVQHFMDANRHFVRKRGRERRDGGEDFSVLRGVALTCGLCHNAVSDITLLPCGHKTVCRGCRGHVVQCPVCHYRVDSTTDDDKAGALFEAISSRW